MVTDERLTNMYRGARISSEGIAQIEAIEVERGTGNYVWVINLDRAVDTTSEHQIYEISKVTVGYKIKLHITTLEQVIDRFEDGKFIIKGEDEDKKAANDSAKEELKKPTPTNSLKDEKIGNFLIPGELENRLAVLQQMVNTEIALRSGLYTSSTFNPVCEKETIDNLRSIINLQRSYIDNAIKPYIQ